MGGSEARQMSTKKLLKMRFPKRSKLWQYNSKLNTLYLSASIEEHHPDYEIDLDKCSNSARVLDWIFQIAAKGWASSEILGDLVLALDECLGPQSNFCSFGADKGDKSVSEIKAIVKENERSRV